MSAPSTATQRTAQATAEATPATHFVLTLTCPDRPGIVHAVTGFLVEAGGNIVQSQQFGDAETGRFFMRVQFETSRAA